MIYPWNLHPRETFVRICPTACIIALSVICNSGCDRDGLSTVPVSGQITFAGGPCPADGTIAFSPVATDDGLPRRPASARFQKDGKFSVTSFNEGDGLLPGRYAAIVSCWLGEPSNKDPASFQRLNAVPSGFTVPEITVKQSDKSVSIRIDVPKK